MTRATPARRAADAVTPFTDDPTVRVNELGVIRAVEDAIEDAVGGPGHCHQCQKPAVIRTVALDHLTSPTGAPLVGLEERTMDLCFHHFWDWNTHSLRRRGLADIAAMLQDHLDRGFFDEAPRAVTLAKPILDRRFLRLKCEHPGARALYEFYMEDGKRKQRSVGRYCPQCQPPLPPKA